MSIEMIVRCFYYNISAMEALMSKVYVETGKIVDQIL